MQTEIYTKVIQFLSATTQPAQKINVTKLHLRSLHTWRYEGIRRDLNAKFKLEIKNKGLSNEFGKAITKRRRPFHIPQVNATGGLGGLGEGAESLLVHPEQSPSKGCKKCEA